MTYFSTDFKKLGWNFLYWLLSLLCEGPFYLVFALILALAQSLGGDMEHFFPWGPLIIWMVSLFSRFISLHVIGSWVLKKVLMARKAGPVAFGLADFILANLWIGAWVLIHPDLMVKALFQSPFLFSPLWYMTIPPVGLASFLFRSIFRGTKSVPTEQPT